MTDEPRLRLDADGRVILDPDHERPKHLHAEAIAQCTLCDTDGLRAGFPCDHIDRTETNQRGIQAVRDALRTKPSTP